MSLIRKIDRNIGNAARWIFSQLTGNILLHTEKRIFRRIQIMEEKFLPALDSIHRLRDDLERHNLAMHKKVNRE